MSHGVGPKSKEDLNIRYCKPKRKKAFDIRSIPAVEEM